ncbi:DUF192 domain-containing protein [Candidatus Nomurabacteria bacterium]|nr:DUF192 domain-containing protein [Candidatus Nomurabacteria bacterium]
MNQKILISFALVVIFIPLFYLTIYPSGQPGRLTTTSYYVKIAGQNIKVEIADTPDKQAQGLSARQGLSEDEGMLFVFENASVYPFWMKDMKFAIDIIWLNEDKEVIYIKKDARPELFPETYGLKNEQGESLLTKYVLEVVSGFSEKNNLKVGDRAEFSY